MRRLDSRQAAILHRLLESNTPLSAGNLGKTMGISARMVRYNLLVVDNWLKDFHASIQVSAHAGISIPLDPNSRKRLDLLLQKEPITPIFNPAERVQMLLFSFLNLDSPQKLIDIITDLSISTATVSRELPEVENWLARYHLYLQRKPRVGLHLVGRENDRRHAMVALLSEVLPEMVLLDYCMWNKKPAAQAGHSPALLAIFETVNNWGLPDLWHLVQRLEEELAAALSDREHLNLVLYLGFTIQRVKQGKTVDISSEQVRDLREEQAYQTASRLFGKSRSALHLSEQEVAQFTLETISLLSQPDLNLHEASTGSENPTRILAEQLAEDVRQQLGFKSPRRDAIDRMSDHLSRSLMRLRYRMPIENPLVNQVEAAFPELWLATTRAVRRVEGSLGVVFPREEIASLLMYLGMAFDQMQRGAVRRVPRVVVACPTGGITVWMLVQRLKQELPELEIVDVVPLRKLTGMKLEGIDAIISTASFEFRDVPVISVNPLFDEEDIANIRQKLAPGITR